MHEQSWPPQTGPFIRQARHSAWGKSHLYSVPCGCSAIYPELNYSLARTRTAWSAGYPDRPEPDHPIARTYNTWSVGSPVSTKLDNLFKPARH